MKNVLKVLFIGLLASVSTLVSAAPISTLNIGGSFSSVTDLEIGSVTEVQLTSVLLSGAATGIFSGTLDGSDGAAGGPVNLMAVAPSVMGFFTVGNAVDSWSFDLMTLYVKDVSAADVLDFGGTGFITNSGDGVAHAVDWTFTASSATAYSMSVTTVVPVPAAVWLFGTGLIGLVGVARRKA